jgi:hypothetical protein
MSGPNSKPLSTSLGEALASKSSEVTLLSRPEAARPSPPSSRPSRIADYRAAPPPQQLHSLPPPAGPDRSFVSSSEEEPRKPRKRRVVGSAEMKAEAARRVLAEEDPNDIAADLGVSRSSVMNWAKEAKLRAFAETSKKFEANDIQKVSAELAEALNLQRAATERVKVLKARLRELLGDE